MASDDNDNALSNGDSTAAACSYASLFALLFLRHAALFVARCWRGRRPAWFCLPFIVGGMMETAGFVTRAIGTRTTTPTTALKVAQVLNILLAPVIFAAAIYMTLGRIMAFAKPSAPSIPSTSTVPQKDLRSRWHPKRWRVTPVFVLGDVACFVVQAIGAGTVAAGGGAKTGGDIVLAGLALQIAVFGVFVAVAVRVHLGIKRRERGELQGQEEREEDKREGEGRRGLKEMCAACVKATGWEGQMVGLYVMSGAVMGRNIYRVVEYVLGAGGYLMQHEWPLYVFDASMMVVVMSVGLRCYALQTATIQKQAGADADKLPPRESAVEGYEMARYLTRRRSSGLS